MGETVIRSRELKQRRRRAELDQKVNEIPAQYTGDIKRFRIYCTETSQPEDMEAMLDYLDHSMNEKKVKKSTWERRLAAVKKYLTVMNGQTYTAEIREEIRKYRAAFRKDEHRDQIRVDGQPTADRSALVKKIMKETEDDTRRRAIALVNLVTANRPSEMVRLQVRDFDLVNHSVGVYMKKQGDWHEKRLTPEVVDAVRAYIQEYGLKKEDYFVGAVDRWGNRHNREVSEVAYHKMIRGLLDVAPYTLRKTQVSSMHAKGADLATIAKQTGHRSLNTISRHYLTVADETIDRFL